MEERCDEKEDQYNVLRLLKCFISTNIERTVKQTFL